jgi:hypothetical protein
MSWRHVGLEHWSRDQGANHSSALLAKQLGWLSIHEILDRTSMTRLGHCGTAAAAPLIHRAAICGGSHWVEPIGR